MASAAGPPMRGNGTLAAARAYLAAGLSVVPIRRDGSKAPDSMLLPHEWHEANARYKATWKPFQERLATEEELSAWFDRAEPAGIGVVSGRVSGNLECLDFDTNAEEIYRGWAKLVETEAPGLLNRLNHTRTPRPAYQVRYRVADFAVPGNLKLASDPEEDEPTLIETRGEGGYALAPGTPAICHSTGRPYEHFAGVKLSQIQAITAAEREILIRCARAFDRGRVDEEHVAGDVARPHGGLSPGDDFNERGDWQTILADWHRVGPDGQGFRWRRPGKDQGWSATTGVCRSQRKGWELLKVFTSNAQPFAPNETYSKFGAYALLHHHADFSAAAKALAEQGYGQPVGNSERCAGDGGQVAPFEAALGPLVLQPGKPRRTAAKLTVPLTVLRDGKAIDRLDLTSAHGNRMGAERLLRRHLDGGQEDVQEVLSRLLAWAGQVADGSAGSSAVQQREGDTLSLILAARVPAMLGLTHRTEKGVWSETRGTELTRAEFLACTSSALLREAAQAIDAPSGRDKLIATINRELAVLWPDLMDKLPTTPPRELGKDSGLASLFRAALLRIWHAPAVHTRELLGDGIPFVHAASLASKANESAKKKDQAAQNDRWAWEQIHKPYRAWWRKQTNESGEIVVRLAMRFELGGQVRVVLPDVRSQRAFTLLGERCKVLDSAPAVPDRLSKGKTRLSVLALDLSEEILGDPIEEESATEAP